MVALRTITKKEQNALDRQASIQNMISRIVDRGSFYLVPSSHCSDSAPSIKNVNDWYIVDLHSNYCECESFYRKNAAGTNACTHKEAARRRQEQEAQYYSNYEMSLGIV